MSRMPHWLGRAGARLTEMGERLDARRAEVEREHAHDAGPPLSTEPSRRPDASPPAPPAAPGHGPAQEPGSGHEQSPSAATATLTGPGAVAGRPEPAAVVPWGVRVAAEAGWRLLVLAGTLWVLMRVISAVQLVVFAFVVALLI